MNQNNEACVKQLNVFVLAVLKISLFPASCLGQCGIDYQEQRVSCLQ